MIDFSGDLYGKGAAMQRLSGKKFAIHIQGCRTNQYEGEAIAAALEAEGAVQMCIRDSLSRDGRGGAGGGRGGACRCMEPPRRGQRRRRKMAAIEPRLLCKIMRRFDAHMEVDKKISVTWEE